MLKKDDKRFLDLMRQPQRAGDGVVTNRPPAASFPVDRYDDLSCSSMSDTGSEQDWNSPSGTKRARLAFDGQQYGPSCSSIASSSSHFQTSALQEPSASHNKPHADEDRRRVRRERNKQAAARCRQRRVDLTNTLIAETETLESEKIRLEKEIESLYSQTHELQFVLDSHSKRCQMMIDTGRSTAADALPAPVDLTAVKSEKLDISVPNTILGRYDTKFGYSRPNSLPVSSSLAMARGTDTPFSGPAVTPCSLTLDFLADGHTGLTPITGFPSAAEVTSSVDCIPSNQTLINL